MNYYTRRYVKARFTYDYYRSMTQLIIMLVIVGFPVLLWCGLVFACAFYQFAQWLFN